MNYECKNFCREIFLSQLKNKFIVSNKMKSLTEEKIKKNRLETCSYKIFLKKKNIFLFRKLKPYHGSQLAQKSCDHIDSESDSSHSTLILSDSGTSPNELSITNKFNID